MTIPTRLIVCFKSEDKSARENPSVGHQSRADVLSSSEEETRFTRDVGFWLTVHKTLMWEGGGVSRFKCLTSKQDTNHQEIHQSTFARAKY